MARTTVVENAQISALSKTLKSLTSQRNKAQKAVEQQTATLAELDESVATMTATLEAIKSGEAPAAKPAAKAPAKKPADAPAKAPAKRPAAPAKKRASGGLNLDL